MLVWKTAWKTVWKTLVLALGAVSVSRPVLAQDNGSHFDNLALNSPTGIDTSIVEGNTGGSFSLTSLSQYDTQGNLCSGYSYDSQPNHILQLDVEDKVELSIWVDSQGKDTTLLVRGSNSLDCADDLSSFNLDAGIYRKEWDAGVYEIWVGSSAPGENYSYQLQVQQAPLPLN